MNHLAKAREVFDIELAALKAVRTLLDKSFDRAVETVVEALKQRGKIVTRSRRILVERQADRIHHWPVRWR